MLLMVGMHFRRVIYEESYFMNGYLEDIFHVYASVFVVVDVDGVAMLHFAQPVHRR